LLSSAIVDPSPSVDDQWHIDASARWAAALMPQSHLACC